MWGIMRFLALSFILFFVASPPVFAAAETTTDSNTVVETSPAEIPQVLIDEALAALILGDEKLCCRVSRTDPKIGELVWGPLYWRRLKILCPQIRPVAIC